MSRREDNVSCIDVTIMDRFAHSALPSSYSKIFPAFRAGAAVTPAAGLASGVFASAVAFTLPTKIAPLALTKRVLNLCKKSLRRFAILA